MDSLQISDSLPISDKPKKIYDYKKYNDAYFLKNRDVKIICDECKKVYSFFNKSHHKNSVYHRKTIEYLNKLI